MNHPDWLKPIHDPRELRRVVNLIVSEIGKLNPKPQFIAVRGVSGTAIGGAVSLVSDLPLVVVRKTDDDSHAKHYGIAQGLRGNSGPYVIIDDLVDTGKTVKAIINAIDDDFDSDVNKRECIAVILYSREQLRLGDLEVNGANVPLVAPNCLQ